VEERVAGRRLGHPGPAGLSHCGNYELPQQCHARGQPSNRPAGWRGRLTLPRPVVPWRRSTNRLASGPGPRLLLQEGPAVSSQPSPALRRELGQLLNCAPRRRSAVD
jgi:hypothetical protein